MRFLKLLIAASVLVGGPIFAAPGLLILPFAKDRGGAVHRQVKEALCAQLTCAKGKKPSKRQPVLAGKVDVKHHRVLLTLRSPGGTVSTTVTLVRGKVTADGISALVQQVGEAVQGAPALQPDASTPTPPIPSEPAPSSPSSPVPSTPTESPTPAAPTPSPSATPAETPTTTAQPAPASEKKESASATEATAPAVHVLVELGADGLNRNFAYQGLTSGAVYGYQAPFIVSPRFHAELYPIAFFSDGWLQGLGLSADYAFAVALKSQLGSTTYPTSFSRLEVAARLRLTPVTGSRFLIAVEAGYSIHNFAIGAAPDGTTITGEPPLAYDAAKLGLELGIPLGDVFTVFLKPEGLYVLSSHQLIGDAYFSKGSGYGLSGELGLRIALGSHIEIVLAGDVIRYSFAFSSAASDAYVAQGATDMFLGGHAAIRFNF